jgi:hypothetical protein
MDSTEHTEQEIEAGTERKSKRRMKSDFPEIPCDNPLCRKGPDGKRKWFKPAWPWNRFCCDECRTAFHAPLNPTHTDAPIRLKALLKSLSIDHPLFKAAQSAVQSRMAVIGNKSHKRVEARDRKWKESHGFLPKGGK